MPALGAGTWYVHTSRADPRPPWSAQPGVGPKSRWQPRDCYNFHLGDQQVSEQAAAFRPNPAV